MPTEINCKTEVDLAMQRAKEKLAEHEKSLEWHKCFNSIMNCAVVKENPNSIHFAKHGHGVICYKVGEYFEVEWGTNNGYRYFFVWEKWSIIHWKRKKFTLQETLNLLAEISVAGKALTFEVE